MLFGKKNVVDLSSSVMAVLCGIIRHQSTVATKPEMSSDKISTATERKARASFISLCNNIQETDDKGCVLHVIQGQVFPT